MKKSVRSGVALIWIDIRSVFFTAVNMDTTIHVEPGLIYIEFLPKGHHKPIEIWLVVYQPL